MPNSILPRRYSAACLVSTIWLVLTACGGGGGGGDSAGGGAASTASLAGNAVKGYLAAATVDFYALSANGSKGSALGTATTDAKGKFTVSLSPAPASSFLAEASGGSYIDEATGASVPMAAGDQLCAVLPAGTTQATITPLTHMACVRARALAAAGAPLDEAVASSNTGTAQQFNVADIIGTLPVAANGTADVPAATREERIYGIVLAGIAQEASSLGVRAVDLAAALAEDLSDGTLNGNKGGVPVTIPNTALTLSAAAGIGALQTAINTFLGSANNKSQITVAAIGSVALPVGINTAGKLYTATTVPPAWISGQTASVTLTAKGGTPPYHCSLKSGSLPTGFTLGSDCVLSGPAATLGAGTTMSISAPFIVTITDSAASPASADQELRITTVAPKPTITAIPATCAVSAPCSASVAQASGGTPPYSFRSDSFLTGAPPLGTVVGLNGSLTGTPSQAGVYTFGVCAVDLVGSSACTQTTVTVNATLTVNIAGTGSGTVSRSPPGPGYPGTTVTLTATPAAGSTFAGWSGACTGTGSCVVTMTTNKTVTATFDSTSSSAAITANPNAVSMTAPVCFTSPCLISQTITIASSTPWTAAPSLGTAFSVSPGSGPAGSTAVTVSYSSFGVSTPASSPTLLTEGGFIRFRTTTIGVFVEVPVTVFLSRFP